MQPTIILAHGAYADSSSWNDVLASLAVTGTPAVAWANPLRGITADATALSGFVRDTLGPIVLVGHSYGGAVITNIDPSAGDISAIVFVAGFALDAGESPVDASSLAPGSTLAESITRVPLDDGSVDTYIAQDKFHHQIAGDLSERQAALMAMTQRPVTEAALGEPSGEHPLWRSVPSWFIFGDSDHNIPVGAHRAMARRASARQTVEIPGASHVVGISHADDVVQIIREAARVEVASNV